MNRFIRAHIEEDTLTVYQSSGPTIADEVVASGGFGPSFPPERVNWVRPSFLRMMARSGWGTKPGQERVLAIEILQEGFDEMLGKAVLTTFDARYHAGRGEWERELERAEVLAEWDPDKDIGGKDTDCGALQLGLSGSVLRRYVEEWVLQINDISCDVRKWGERAREGGLDPSVLPREHFYSVGNEVARRLGMY